MDFPEPNFSTKSLFSTHPYKHSVLSLYVFTLDNQMYTQSVGRDLLPTTGGGLSVHRCTSPAGWKALPQSSQGVFGFFIIPVKERNGEDGSDYAKDGPPSLGSTSEVEASV